MNANATAFVPRAAAVIAAEPATLATSVAEREMDIICGYYGAENAERVRGGDAVRVSLRMPPDFPFDLEGGRLCVEVQFDREKFPTDPCRVSFPSEGNSTLPDRLRGRMAQSANARIAALGAYRSNPAMASGILKWIRNTAERLLVDKLLTEEHKSGISVSVVKRPTGPVEDDPSLLAPPPPPPPVVVADVDSSSALANDSSEEAAQEGQGQRVAQFPTTTAHRGTQMLVEGLVLVGVGVVQCGSVRLVFNCGRCKTTAEVSLQHTVSSTLECDKCHGGICVTFRPEILHENTSIFGYLDTTGCKPVEVLPSDVEVSCLSCSEMTRVPVFRFGQTHSLTCRQCHQPVSLRAERLVFVRVKQEGASAEERRGSGREKKPKDTLGLHVGTPLPSEGTCKHYKRSYRWLRFPCCGRAFPCDVCHDAASDHEGSWATRMLCGHCSKEQPFSNDKPCANCGRSMTSSSSNRAHWEGGKGCRNTASMSKKDRHKYKSSGPSSSAKKSK